MTPNYVRSLGISLSPWCDCGSSGNSKPDCERFAEFFTHNRCLREFQYCRDYDFPSEIALFFAAWGQIDHLYRLNLNWPFEIMDWEITTTNCNRAVCGLPWVRPTSTTHVTLTACFIFIFISAHIKSITEQFQLNGSCPIAFLLWLRLNIC